jgi:hypothetical protein
MVGFKSFEKGYETATAALDEGVIDGLKNYLSRMFGGKVKKLDNIVKSLREADRDYWKEWSDRTTKYNQASVIYDRAADPVERAKQKETMDRLKKAGNVMDQGREDYRAALEKQASLIIGSNERLKDYFEMEKAKMDAELAQHTYVEVQKISDEKLVDDAYKRLADTLSRIKQRDTSYRAKYGDDYRKNLFGMSDHDFGHYAHGFTDSRFASLDVYLTMDDRTFAYAITKMDDRDAERLGEELREELKKVKEELEEARERTKHRVEGAGGDKGAARTEKEQGHHKEHEFENKVKHISRKIGALTAFAASK